jgi:toxin ParE1/3/4
VARVIVTSAADADLSAILADLGARAGAIVAERYNADIDCVYGRLADYPKSGAPRLRLGRRVRICVVSPYIVFYEHFETQNEVVIMRVAHGRRKITRKFLRGL